MAEFEFKCPQCGGAIEADDSFRGQTVECPHCGKGIVVPAPQVRLHPLRRENPTQMNGEIQRAASVPGREGASNGLAVPFAVSGALQKNEDNIRDAFNREVKTIKSTANVMLIREIIIFITVGLVIAGTIGGIWYHYHKRNQAEQIAWQREQERKRLEEEEHAKREEARKKAQEEERLARERERKRIEEENLAKEAAEKAAEQRRKKYEALAQDYREFELDYLRNAPKGALPEGVKNETVYSCLMADDVAGIAFFRVVVTPGKPMTVQRLSADADPVDVPVDIFNERCRTESYLMVADSRPYISPWKKSSHVYPVPKGNDKINPTIEELGSSLYRIVKELGLRTNLLRYDVFLKPKEEYQFELETLPVEQVGFGGELSIEDFRAVVRAKLEGKSRERADAYRRMAASRGTGGGKTRAHAALERNLAATTAEAHASRSSHVRTTYTGYSGNIIYQSHKERTGPTRQLAGKIADLEVRLRAEERARAQRQRATERRNSEEDAKFERENAVTEDKVDKMLKRYVVVFRLAK